MVPSFRASSHRAFSSPQERFAYLSSYRRLKYAVNVLSLCCSYSYVHLSRSKGKSSHCITRSTSSKLSCLVVASRQDVQMRERWPGKKREAVYANASMGLSCLHRRQRLFFSSINYHLPFYLGGAGAHIAYNMIGSHLCGRSSLYKKVGGAVRLGRILYTLLGLLVEFRKLGDYG